VPGAASSATTSRVPLVAEPLRHRGHRGEGAWIGHCGGRRRRRRAQGEDLDGRDPFERQTAGGHRRVGHLDDQAVTGLPHREISGLGRNQPRRRSGWSLLATVERGAQEEHQGQ
jgi:hypothetical protein